MSNVSDSTNASGISFLGMLFIAFLVLKLCGVIDWSWWWVTTPLWGPAAGILVVCFTVVLFAAVIKKKRARR